MQSISKNARTGTAAKRDCSERKRIGRNSKKENVKMFPTILYRLKVFFSRTHSLEEEQYREKFHDILPNFFKAFLNHVFSGNWGNLLEHFKNLDDCLSEFNYWLNKIEISRRPNAYVLIRTIEDVNDLFIFEGQVNFIKPTWLPEQHHFRESFHITAVTFLHSIIRRICEHYDYKWWCIHKYDMIRHVIHLQKLYFYMVPEVYDREFPILQVVAYQQRNYANQSVAAVVGENELLHN